MYVVPEPLTVTAVSAPLSILILTEDGLIPEPESVSLKSILGLLDVIVAEAVGYVKLATGATVSLTLSLQSLPNVECVSSMVVVFPASSVAVNVTG